MYVEENNVTHIAGFISKKGLDMIDNKDIVFTEEIRSRRFGRHVLGYYIVVKYKPEYLNLFSL